MERKRRETRERMKKMRSFRHLAMDRTDREGGKERRRGGRRAFRRSEVWFRCFELSVSRRDPLADAGDGVV